MTSSRSKLQLSSLSKSYGAFRALAEADLEMPEGEFLTLLGPSGSGKTTLLSLIAGLTSPDSGKIIIDGRDATWLPAKERDLGLVFQNYALFPHLTVFENVAFPLRMRRRPEPEIKQSVGAVLDIVQLQHLADRLPGQLSGGQQQRVALARCFVYRPSIILMDEPLGALDKKLRDRMQIEIRRLAREFRASVIFVTHDQEEALVMSDRICLLNGGAIVQIGSPADLYFTPRSLFAAEFIGDSNLLPIIREADGSVLQRGQRIECREPAPLPVGAAHIVVRPERLRLLRPGETATNVLDADIQDIILTGAMTRVYAAMSDGTPLVAAMPSSVDGLLLSPGGSVRLGFEANDAVAVRDEEAPARSL